MAGDALMCHILPVVARREPVCRQIKDGTATVARWIREFLNPAGIIPTVPQGKLVAMEFCCPSKLLRLGRWFIFYQAVRT